MTTVDLLDVETEEVVDPLFAEVESVVLMSEEEDDEDDDEEDDEDDEDE